MVILEPCQLQRLAALRPDDKDLVSALMQAGVSNPLSIRRPAWLRIIVPVKGNTSYRFCLHIHDINLWIAAAVRYKGYLSAIRGPCRGNIDARILCEPFDNVSLYIHEIEIRIIFQAQCDNHGSPIRRPGGSKIES